MTCLTREELFKPLDRKRRVVELEKHGFPAGSYVCVQELSAEGLLDLQTQFKSEGDTANVEFCACLLKHCLCDDDGKALCQSDDDVRGVLGKSFKVFQTLAEAAVEISGLAFRDEPEKKGPVTSPSD
jgi:hypothetical protein